MERDIVATYHVMFVAIVIHFDVRYNSDINKITLPVTKYGVSMIGMQSRDYLVWELVVVSSDC